MAKHFSALLKCINYNNLLLLFVCNCVLHIVCSQPLSVIVTTACNCSLQTTGRGQGVTDDLIFSGSGCHDDEETDCSHLTPSGEGELIRPVLPRRTTPAPPTTTRYAAHTIDSGGPLVGAPARSFLADDLIGWEGVGAITFALTIIADLALCV